MTMILALSEGEPRKLMKFLERYLKIKEFKVIDIKKGGERKRRTNRQ